MFSSKKMSKGLLSSLASQFKVMAPLKMVTSRPSGINLDGILLSKIEYNAPGTTRGKNAPATSRSAVESELHGVTPGQKATGVKSSALGANTKHSFLFQPTGIDKLVDEWLRAPPEAKENLPYVPVFGALVPTIAVRFSGGFKEPTAAKNADYYCFFQIPVDRDEYHIQNLKPIVVSTFIAVSIPSFPCHANLISFTYAPKLKMELNEDYLDQYIKSPNMLIVEYPSKKHSNIILYTSCSSITLSTGPLDDLPREYKQDAYLFNPNYQYDFTLEEIKARDSRESRHAYEPMLIPLHLSKETRPDSVVGPFAEGGRQCLYSTSRVAPYSPIENFLRSLPEDSENDLCAGTVVTDVNFSEQLCLYETQFCQRKANQNGFILGHEPSAYINQTASEDKDGNIRYHVGMQIAFTTLMGQYVEYPLEREENPPTCVMHRNDDTPQTPFTQGGGDAEDGIPQSSQGPPTDGTQPLYSDSFRPERVGNLTSTNGQLILSLWENQIDECGVQSEFASLMASHGIPCSVLFQVYSKKTMEIPQNTSESSRQEYPAGLIHGGSVVTYWHVIEYARKHGIPVTASWAKKALDGSSSNDNSMVQVGRSRSNDTSSSSSSTYYPPQDAKLRQNIANAKPEEYGFVNLSELPPSYNKEKYFGDGWKFAVLFDYNLQSIPADFRKEVKNLTPEDGANLLDMNPLSSGNRIILQARNTKTFVIVAYKYNPEWEKRVESFKKKRTTVLSNWRIMRTYFKCLETYALIYYVFPQNDFPNLLRYHLNEGNPRTTYPETPSVLDYDASTYVENTTWGDIVYDFFEKCGEKNQAIFSSSISIVKRKFFKEFISCYAERFHPKFVKWVSSSPLEEEPVATVVSSISSTSSILSLGSSQTSSSQISTQKPSKIAQPTQSPQVNKGPLLAPTLKLQLPKAGKSVDDGDQKTGKVGIAGKKRAHQQISQDDGTSTNAEAEETAYHHTKAPSPVAKKGKRQ